MPGKTKGLLERLEAKEPVIVAEGYLFEMERRCYLQAGSFVPEVVLKHPEVVKQLHEEFVHAGSDVVEAFTYYAHREKMRLIGRENDLEEINRRALRIARQVADETNTLMAGNICNSTLYAPTDEARAAIRQMFKEQIEWAVEEGADFIIGETFGAVNEALLALECIKTYGKGLPAVITMAVSATSRTAEGLTLAQAICRLHEAGADVAGVNCHGGLSTVLPIMREARAMTKGHLACLPVPFKTNENEKVMGDLSDPETGVRCFPDEMDQMVIPRRHIAPFVRELQELGVQYMGLCCGNRAFYIRAMAEALGRLPPASQYSPDMSKHFSNFKGDNKYSFTRDNYHANTSVKKFPQGGVSAK